MNCKDRIKGLYSHRILSCFIVPLHQGSSFYQSVQTGRKVRATKGSALPNRKVTEGLTDSVTETKPPHRGKGETVG